MERDVKGFPISKAFTCMNVYEHLPLQTKTIILAILFYEQFIHLTRIHLRPNVQFFEYSAACLTVILVTSWFDSVCVTVTCWVNFREKHLHKHELQLSDYNV